MIKSEISTAQAALAQGAGNSPYNNDTGGSNRRQQLKDRSNTGNRAFVPISGHRSGAADVRAITARWDRDQNQGQNGSRGGKHEFSKMVEEAAEQINEKANAPASARSDAGQNISNAATDQDDGLADKLATVKSQIADLLDRIESSQPGFAKAVAPKVESNATAVEPVAKSGTSNKQSLLAFLHEAAGFLEELLDLLQNNNTDNAGGNDRTVMAAVAAGYAPASSRPEVKGAVEMFMSIYHQLSADAQMEVVEILTALAFERQEAEDGIVNTATSPSEYPPSADHCGNINQNAVAGVGVAADALRVNPEILSRAGIQGIEVTGMDLFADSGGMLSEKSKIEVNKLISYLSDLLGGIEVVANVYVDDSSNIGVHLTSGEECSVVFYPMEGTIYSPHVHTSGSWIPSTSDLENEIAGAEDTIVVSDGVAGNETGDYFQYG